MVGRKGIIRQGMHAKIVIYFGQEEFSVELTINTTGEGAGFIDLAHNTRNRTDPRPISYRIYLNWTCPNYGGRRYWFYSGERTTKLFLPRGGHRFMSRAEHQLGYACQRENRSNRLMRKSRKLHRALGGDGECEEVPAKPKGMHWRTYERKVAAWCAADERAEEASCQSIAPPPWAARHRSREWMK
jgi:hypothetical protein